MAKLFDETQLVGITCKTLQDLFEKGGPDCVALYFKYVYHTKYQKTNKIWATDKFMAEGLGWSLRKVKLEKKKLKDLGYLDVIPYKNPKTKRVEKWFCEVKKLLTSTKTNAVFSLKNKSQDTEEIRVQSAPPCPIQSAKIPPSGIGAPKCLKDNKNKCLKDNNLQQPPLTLNGYTPTPDHTAHTIQLYIILNTQELQALSRETGVKDNEVILHCFKQAKDDFISKGLTPKNREALLARTRIFIRNYRPIKKFVEHKKLVSLDAI